MFVTIPILKSGGPATAGSLQAFRTMELAEMAAPAVWKKGLHAGIIITDSAYLCGRRISPSAPRMILLPDRLGRLQKVKR